MTIHDLTFFEHDLYDPTFTKALRQAVLDSVRRATHVIALSEYTRKNIERIIGRASNVSVVYGAGNYPDHFTRTPGPNDSATLAGAGVRGKYVLYVGDFNPRKNIDYLIASFARLKRREEFSDMCLVLVGNSAAARSALVDFAANEGVTHSDLVFAGRVSDEELAIFYRNAEVFALCSIGEGFTLVTLEAMSYGIPVVATDTSSIAEGTGTAAELVPLGSPEVVAAALARVLTPGTRREEMRQLGFHRVQMFTWQEAARRTLAVYASAIARQFS